MPRVSIYNTSPDDVSADSIGVSLIPGRSTVEADLTDEQLEGLKGHAVLEVTAVSDSTTADQGSDSVADQDQRLAPPAPTHIVEVEVPDGDVVTVEPAPTAAAAAPEAVPPPDAPGITEGA